MKNKEKGFTLVEILSVVVILGISFIFIIPNLTSLIAKSETREIELIEERVLVAAKEYANNYNASFYKKLIKEGDTNYIYKSDLLNAGLVNEEDVSKLNTFAGVKGELLANEKVKYTLEYINASSNEYTNEELYLMMKNLTNEVQNLKNQSGGSSGSVNISLLSVYPVGSVYVSTVSTNPGTLFGGTWTQLKDRFLLGAGDTYTAGSTGGESEHILTIDEMPSHKHGLKLWGGSNDATGHSGILPWGRTTNVLPTTLGELPQNFQIFDENMYSTGGSQPHNNMPPYLTVYMWKRTA